MITPDEIEKLAAWSVPKEINTKRGPRLLRKAEPTQALTDAIRASAEAGDGAMYAAGVSVGYDTYARKILATWWMPIPEAIVEARAEAVIASRSASADVALPAPAGLEYLPFQKAGIAYGLARQNVLIADEMGLGKTIQAIGIINAAPDITSALIVCPKSLKLNWYKEMQRWLTRPLSVAVADGTWPSADIVIINYEGVKKYKAYIQARDWSALVLDECHYIKNSKTERSAMIKGRKADDKKGLAAIEPIRASRHIRLSGTPFLNRPIELQNVIADMDPMWANFFGYAKRYCNPPEAPIWMGDFSFKSLGDIKVGDDVIGWKVGEPGPRNKSGQARATLVRSRVTHVMRRQSYLVKVTFASGRTLRCTPDHRWLSHAVSNLNHQFVEAKVGRSLVHVIDPVGAAPADLAYELGYLNGIYDGEGTWPRIAQDRDANPEVSQRIQAALTRCQFATSEPDDFGINILGGRQTAVRFINWCKPTKTKWIERRILTGRFRVPDKVVSVVSDGYGEVISLTTETGNYVAWGYASKNCDAKQIRAGRKMVWDFSGASNLDELQRKLRESIMVRRLKADVLTELPPKRRQVIELDPTGAILAALEAEREAEAGLSDGAREDEELAFTEYSKARHDTALAKVPAVIEHLESFMDEDGTYKVIVGAHHRDVIEALAEACRARGWHPVYITGETSIIARQAAVDAFQGDPATRVFIGSILAAGVGLTLTASSHVVFAELDWVPGNLTQFEDRAHRIGQRDSVLVQHLVIAGSIDSKFVEKIVSKQAVLTAALDAETRPVPVYVAPEPRPARIERKAAPVAAPASAEAPRESDGPSLTAEQVAAIHSGLRLLAGMDTDRAAERNGQGFNKLDGTFGHSLAEAPRLSGKQAAAGLKLVRKYRRQIPADLLAEAGIK